MRLSLLCVLAVLAGCSKKETDSAESEVLCPGDSIYVEVCVECGDAGGCEETVSYTHLTLPTNSLV